MSNLKCISCALSLFLLALLAGCQQLPQKIPVQFSTQQQAQTQLNYWLLTGKVGIRLNKQASRADIIWQQQPDHYELTLQGPFGSGALQLIGTPEQATLITAEGTQQAPNAEILIKQQLGWSVPVEYLAWWAQGLPTPDLPLQGNATYDEQHHLTGFTQDNWTITLAEYKTTSTDNSAISTVELPYRITLNKASLRLTLVIAEWKNLNF